MVKNVSNYDEMDDLFNSENLDSKMDFLNDRKSANADGVYKVDLAKVKDKKRGYRSVVRFLPNLTKDGKVGQSAIEKIAHYVDIKSERELSGWFDSAKNFNEKCPLTDLYYTLTNSKNAILQEKAKCLKYSKKYYSYVLILEDEQQPELVGKIMIFQYGKTIREKILAEKNGEITGVNCNVFDLSSGKDFVMLVKEISTGDETYPDYKNSMFRPETSAIQIFSEEKGTFRTVPLVEGKVDPKAQGIVREFLLNRDHEIEELAPKPLTDDQKVKVANISAYLTGKSHNASTGFAENHNTRDFELGDVVSSGSAVSVEDEEDFFSDFNS